MFGYVVPEGKTLSRRDFSMFQSTYCGLCLSNKATYGNWARLTTNYDATVLGLLLIEAVRPQVEFGTCRCIGDFRKKPFVRDGAFLSRLRDANILLCSYKIVDDETDGGSKHRAMRRILKKPTAAAKAALPDADRAIAEGYARLRALERAKETSIDRAADCFAKLLENLAVCLVRNMIADDGVTYSSGESAEERAARLAEGSDYLTNFRGLCYNIGKFVYLADALDDLAEDAKKGNYNPFLAAYPDFGKGGKRAFVKKRESDLRFCFNATVNRAVSCLNRLPLTQVGDLLRNVVYGGLRAKTEELFAAKKKLPPPRLRIEKEKKRKALPEGKGE